MPFRNRLLSCCLGLLVVSACSPGTRGLTGGGGATKVRAIAVEPSPATVANGDGLVGEVQFKAIATLDDGETQDVTSTVTWSLSEPQLGAIRDGRFVAGPARGGIATVRANATGGVQGTATLTVRLTRHRVATEDGSTAPADAAKSFASGAVDPSLAPTIAYPLDGSFVPRNLGALEAQWTMPAAAVDLFEVELTGPTLDLHVYTNARQPAGGRMLLTDEDWAAIASATDGEPMALVVRARAATDPMKIGESKPVSFAVGKDGVEGGIYYWAASGGPTTEGVQRHAFGDVKSIAKPYYTQSDGYGPGGENHCVACHAISRDGTKMAVTYDGGDGLAGIIDVATRKPIVPASAGLRWNFAAFNPDGTQLVTARDGALTIRDATTGAPITPIPGVPGASSSHPDWSPDGKSIVFAATNARTHDWQFTAGAIAVLTDAGAGFAGTTATLLVQAAPGENSYYPTFSPDGKWILYNRSRGDAYANADATMWIVPTDGSAAPMQLKVVDGVGELANSWCRWSPFVQRNGPDGDLLYFTFSSKRDYGIEIVGAARPQIWMAAFNPRSTEAGMMPVAYAPFWLPFQDPATSNHIAQWTQAIVGIQ